MAFGKRGRPNPPQAAPQPAVPSPQPGLPSLGNSVLWRQLRGIGIGIAIVLGLNLAYYVGMLSLGKALSAKWAAGDSIDWTLIVPYPSAPQTGIEANLRNACLRLQDVIRTPSQTDEFRYQAQLGWSRQDQLTTIARFLACSTEHAPHRFCRAEERARFVGQLTHYLKFREIVVSGNAATGVAVPFEETRYLDKIVTRPASEGEHDRLGRGLRALAERGLLSARDFGVLGFGVPAEIAPFIKNVEIKERPCA